MYPKAIHSLNDRYNPTSPQFDESRVGEQITVDVSVCGGTQCAPALQPPPTTTPTLDPEFLRNMIVSIILDIIGILFGHLE